ncbi:MAG: hypothetical protein RIR00_1897 [Pseudomonadota bacterium]|jgi:hypothetical protein
MQNSKDRPILEATLECGEVIFDALVRDEILTEIPIIGTAIKFCKAIDSIKERAFATKLLRFSSEIDKLSNQTRQKIKEKIASSPTEATRIGETLLLTLDRITDLEKAQLLSYFFLAHIDSIITKSELRRFAQIIDASFYDDLKKFLETKDISEKSEETWMQFLSQTGLTCAAAGKTWADSGRIYYEVTLLGNNFRCAYNHGRKMVY